LAARWEKMPPNVDAAKLKVTRIPGVEKPKVTLSLSEATLSLQEPGDQDIPKDHLLISSTLSNQTIGAFSVETDPVTGAEKVRMEGEVQQRLECRPIADKSYIQLKAVGMKKVAEPVRKLIKLDEVVQNFKPVIDHQHNVSTCSKLSTNLKSHIALIFIILSVAGSLKLLSISNTGCILSLQIEYEEKKKTEGKRCREDRDTVLEMLFSAFEKHQYYTLKDLVRLTNQPVVSLRIYSNLSL
jgi:transcription initiation factor TFIIF subunit beta